MTDDKGAFCFEVKPGNYLVSPLVTAEEKDKGLRLLPQERQVMVEGSPVLNVNFNQSKLSISGKLKCIEKNDSKC